MGSSDEPPALIERIVRLSILCVNILLVFTGCLVLLGIAVAYVYPTWCDLIYSVQHLINVHAFMGVTGGLGLGMVLLGTVGLYSLRIDSNLFLGLQVFAMIFLLVIEAGIFYATLSHWVRDMEVGVVFAVQSFRPSTSDRPTMAGIQVALQCCGRGSYTDYYIANEAIVKGYVPYSCCDTRTHNSSFCRRVAVRSVNKTLAPVPQTNPDRDRHAWLVPSPYAYSAGCQQRVKLVVMPLTLTTLSIMAGIMIIATFFEAVYLNVTHVEEPDSETGEGQTADD